MQQHKPTCRGQIVYKYWWEQTSRPSLETVVRSAGQGSDATKLEGKCGSTVIPISGWGCSLMSIY